MSVLCLPVKAPQVDVPEICRRGRVGAILDFLQLRGKCLLLERGRLKTPTHLRESRLNANDTFTLMFIIEASTNS